MSFTASASKLSYDDIIDKIQETYYQICEGQKIVEALADYHYDNDDDCDWNVYQSYIDDWNYEMEEQMDEINDGIDPIFITETITEMDDIISLLKEEHAIHFDAYKKARCVRKIENYYLNAKYNPRTQIGEKFVNKLYDENF